MFWPNFRVIPDLDNESINNNWRHNWWYICGKVTRRAGYNDRFGEIPFATSSRKWNVRGRCHVEFPVTIGKRTENRKQDWILRPNTFQTSLRIWYFDEICKIGSYFGVRPLVGPLICPSGFHKIARHGFWQMSAIGDPCFSKKNVSLRTSLRNAMIFSTWIFIWHTSKQKLSSPITL